MSKEKQIEERCENCLHYGACVLNSEYIPTPCRKYEDKAEWHKQSEGEWISVEERLPKQWEMVLVFCDDIISTDFISSTGRWYEHIDHDSVTHWMPLPEPPMKGGAE